MSTIDDIAKTVLENKECEPRLIEIEKQIRLSQSIQEGLKNILIHSGMPPLVLLIQGRRTLDEISILLTLAFHAGYEIRKAEEEVEKLNKLASL